MMFLCIECGKYLDENKKKFYRKVKNRCEDYLKKKFEFHFCGKFFLQKMVENSY